MQENELYIVTPWYNTFSGGAEVAARTLAEESVKRGIKVTVLTTCCKTPYDNWWKNSMQPGDEVVNGVCVKRFALNEYGREKYEGTIVKQINNQEISEEDKLNFYMYGISSDDLCDYIATIQDGVPIIVLPYFQALAYNVITKNPYRVSMIPCFHNESQFYWNQIDDMIKYCNRIFYLSEPEKDMTIKQYGYKHGKKVIEGIVLGLGVEISNEIRQQLLNQENNQELPSKYIVYVGRKDIGKGVKELIHYHKKVPENIPLVFVGGGDQSLIPLDDKRFIDYGFVDTIDKYRIIKNASALVNLSPNESFSIVIMEAWLMEVPVIVSNRCDVTRHHCEVSNGGFWINDESDYKKIVEYIINNQDICHRIGIQGKEYVQVNYCWDNVIYNLFANYDCEVNE